MDISSFFGSASSSKSADISSSSEDEVDSNQSDTECLEPSPANKRLTVQEKHRIKHWQANYKQLKIQEEMGRELYLIDIR